MARSRRRILSPATWAVPLLAACMADAANYPAIPADLTTPVQQRLAINGRNSISVGWNTYTQLSKPCVRYGTAPDQLTAEACGDPPVTYPTSRTYSNAVTLTGLKPATTYYYQIVSTNSTIEHVLSPRLPGDPTPFTMNVVIDLGVYGEDGYTINMDMTKRDTIPQVQPALNHTTIGRLAQTVDAYEFVLHPGDFAYADDWFYNLGNVLDGTHAYEAILEEFYNQLAPVAGRKPYQASPGNHEATCEELPYVAELLCPAGQKNFTDFRNRFGRTMPVAFPSASVSEAAQVAANTARQLANPPFWYSFEYGLAHVVMIDTETDFPNAPDTASGSSHLGGGPFGASGQQLAFLEADLASVDRTVTPWLVVGGHRPWYSTGGSGNVCAPCQAAFEPLFYKYGVDVGIFGHVHNAQRFLPVHNGVADPAGLQDPKAPVYIVAGGAGNVEGLSSVGANASTNVFAYADDFSYAAVTFEDAQHLKIDFFRSATGALLDSSVLYKAHKEQFVIQE
ncbi:metallo-phosphoesterase [Niveomyces insectorum RCEF 264]|uniref:Purple acid phosphatase n=1 Tax=Niveomyces insectorum RCEF 264 TaxID=1081102 RepID=A0A162L636_9HYPO|nr:metallo-phosphoesterase [Niveomyces insectorum RCEF 264]